MELETTYQDSEVLADNDAQIAKIEADIAFEKAMLSMLSQDDDLLS